MLPTQIVKNREIHPFKKYFVNATIFFTKYFPDNSEFLVFHTVLLATLYFDDFI